MEIQEVIRQRQIAEETGLSRATVRKCLSAAKGELIAQRDPLPAKSS